MSYPDGAVVRIEDFGPLERAYAEAAHEGCEELPLGHPVDEHSPWSGGDLDGVPTWQEWTDLLSRHGIALVSTAPLEAWAAELVPWERGIVGPEQITGNRACRVATLREVLDTLGSRS